MTIEEYNTTFRINGQKAGYDFSDGTLAHENPHQTTLRHYYLQGIKKELARQIVIAGEPPTINALMTKAAEIDAAFRRTTNMFSDRLGKKSSWKPKFYTKQLRTTDYGEPMDIDAVTYQHGRQGG